MSGSDFGHHGARIQGGFVDSWGAGPFTVGTGNRKWRFEYSDRFGPVVLNRYGDPSVRQPNEQSDFWGLFDEWLRKHKAR